MPAEGVRYPRPAWWGGEVVVEGSGHLARLPKPAQESNLSHLLAKSITLNSPAHPPPIIAVPGGIAPAFGTVACLSSWYGGAPWKSSGIPTSGCC